MSSRGFRPERKPSFVWWYAMDTAFPARISSVFMLLVLASGWGIASRGVAQTQFAPGTQTRVDDATVSGGHYVVWVPRNHDATQTWPVVVYYHGQDGQPNTRLFRGVTSGQDFIVVGMEYSQRGVLRHNTAERNAFIARELASFRYVRDRLVEELNADADRFVIAGFSKGGWLSSLYGDRLADELAGYAILGGGRLDQEKSPAKRAAVASTPIYVGAGENDYNIEWTRYAAAMYRGFKSDVTLEVYPGLAHEVTPGAPLLHNWLYAVAVWSHGDDEDRSAHDAWLEERVAEIVSVGVPVDQWRKLKRLGDEPRFDVCSQDARERWAEELRTRRRDPTVVQESRAQSMMEKLETQELAFRLKRPGPTVKRLLAGYENVIRRCPQAPSVAQAEIRRDALRDEFGDGG